MNCNPCVLVYVRAVPYGYGAARVPRPARGRPRSTRGVLRKAAQPAPVPFKSRY